MKRESHHAYALFSLGLLAAAGAAWTAAIGWLWFRQEHLLFEPVPLPGGERLVPDEDVHEHTVQVPGAALSVAQLRRPAPRGVVFFLHGNSGNLRDCLVDLDAFREANFDLVAMDYRGYGKSSGHIASEEQLRADVRAVWNHFAGQYTGQRIVIAGQSLGTGLAAGLSAELGTAGQPPHLTLLVSAYSSMRALGEELYPWVPGRVLRYPLHTVEHVGKLQGPLVLIHGDCDELIGIHHSRALATALPTAQLHCLEGAGHGDVHRHPSFRKAVAGALACL
ncbi:MULTISPECIES: alpha/beta fold hydrolase [Ramlibacter]|uniref:Alpha/beta fold hydrolase n=1 Tax=Ramlibacter aquaticus TaxID=2780094 RepID=A0ABR9SEN7_9BURK|nr:MULTISPECIES: alpha/beta fold hydrolase [Ramlibacter]MBE7940826.1 alpha/beta fold hydrolase [Ramlibacter aquaticus]